MRWTTKKNKIMHRMIQGIILILGPTWIFLLIILLYTEYDSPPFEYDERILIILGFLGFFIFLIWAFRIRKLTTEEVIFRQDIRKLEELREKNLLLEEEYQIKRSSLFTEFLNKFKSNKKRPFEYKIERLSSLREDDFISEEEFKQGKAILIEKPE